MGAKQPRILLVAGLRLGRECGCQAASYTVGSWVTAGT